MQNAKENSSIHTSPLSDVLVLDLSRILAGPYCTMFLGDLGADVIKIEQPGMGDGSRQWGPPWAGGESAYYLCVNRNKRSVAINLKTDRGREIVKALATKADVLIENFKLGTMETWGLGYENLRASNPGLIYCSITGYGQYGPHADRPGYDFIIQAEGGIMSICGPTDGPPHKVGVAIVDITAGMYAGIAILAALHERSRSGEGHYIDIALLDSQVAWLANVASNYLISGDVPTRFGNAHPNIVPYEAFKARDRWFAIGVGTDRQFRRLCEILGEPDLADDPLYATNPMRVENRRELVSILGKLLLHKDVEYWIEKLTDVGIPCAPINTIDRVFNHPQVKARNMITTLSHPTAKTINLVGSPIKMSRTPISFHKHPPLLGEHTDSVLEGLLDLDKGELKSLHEAGVIA